MSRIKTLDYRDWSPQLSDDESQALAAQLESGEVLYLPQLAFALSEAQRRFLDPRFADPKAKNLSFDGERGILSGAVGSDEECDALRAMIVDFRRHAIGLIEALLPRYRQRLRVARTSFRPVRVEGRPVSWRKDDSRLHIDAFPSRPNRGERILRVFSNVNPAGEPRIWRVGEAFEETAKTLLPGVKAPLPGSAWLLETLHITKSRRSAYDHYMLGLHDRMKADASYQREVPQQTVQFAAGSSWICFSDQTAHAATSGQFMFEQTLHLPVAAMYQPTRSPLRTLERITGRRLV